MQTKNFPTIGTYKPRFRAYDVHELCLKFERGLDAEVINFQILSEDYSKVSAAMKMIFCLFVAGAL